MERRLVDQPVSYDRRGNAAVITIQRPERRNAVDGPTADALEAAYSQWLDDLDAKGYRSNWSRDTKYLPDIPNNFKAENNTIVTAIKMCANNLNDIDFASSMNMLSMLNDADYGFTQSGPSYNGYDFNNTVDNLKKMIDNNNQSEHARSSNMVFDDDFIRYAHLKEQLK